MQDFNRIAHLRQYVIIALFSLIPISASTTAQYQVETVATGFNHAWGMAFVPYQRWLLVSERPGQLKRVNRDTGAVTLISGLPDIYVRGQGGLLDIALHPDYPDQPWLYLSYSVRDGGFRQSTTAVGRGILDLEAGLLRDFEELYRVQPAVASNAHYGSRLAFDTQGYLYITVGDRNSKDFGPQHYSQDISNDLGAILRLHDDGRIPVDNPFVDDHQASPAIFSYGHRNPQGLAFHPQTGELWENEHGERNGDEVNIIQAGGNYGWPIATYGVSYMTGRPFAVTPPESPDTVNPVYYWEPDHPEGFPPSGLAFYFGEAFPEWQGNLFMGNLRHQYLGRFSVDGHTVEQTDRLLEGRGWRIRDVGVGPDDGLVYVLIDQSNAPLVRLRPTSD
jgi:glucose/arabinose dehydrogenase